MLRVGDIVLVNTTPPHIASVTGGGMVVCEDGTHLPLDQECMTLLYNALQIVQEIEKGVLLHADGG